MNKAQNLPFSSTKMAFSHCLTTYQLSSIGTTRTGTPGPTRCSFPRLINTVRMCTSSALWTSHTMRYCMTLMLFFSINWRSLTYIIHITSKYSNSAVRNKHTRLRFVVRWFNHWVFIIFWYASSASIKGRLWIFLSCPHSSRNWLYYRKNQLYFCRLKNKILHQQLLHLCPVLFFQHVTRNLLALYLFAVNPICHYMLTWSQKLYISCLTKKFTFNIVHLQCMYFSIFILQ